MGIRKEIIKELLDKVEAMLDATAFEIAASALSAVNASAEINATKPQDSITNLVIFNDDIYSWDRHGRVKRLSNNKWETVAIFDEGIDKMAIFCEHLCVNTIKTEEQPSKVYRSWDGETWELQKAGAANTYTAKITKSEDEANLLPVKGQELHIYTGEPPSALNKIPEGTLLCKAILGDTVTIRCSGKASYGLLVKDNQYVDCIEIDTIPAKGKMRVPNLEFYQGCYFTIDKWQ